MVASQNFNKNTKCPIVNDSKLPKKATKKTAPKIVFFVLKSQTCINNQDVN